MKNKIQQYRIIYEVLKNEIEQNAYKEGSFLPSEKEISERFQVDRTTVRKSLKLLVEDSLIEKKAGLGSVVLSRKTKNEKEKIYKPILFLLPKSIYKIDRITQPYYSSLFFYIEKYFDKNGFSMIYSTTNDVEMFTSLIETSNICGIIFITNTPTEIIEKTLVKRIPSLLVNNYNPRIISITANHFEGAYSVVNHLIDLGHKEIGFISGIKDYYTTKERMAGALRALKEKGLTLSEKHIADGDWQFDGGYKAMKEIMERTGKKPTAIFCFNDTMALGAIKALRDMNIKVPEEMSVSGFDNIETIYEKSFNLTTVDVHIKETAKITVNTLISIMNKNFTFPMKIEVPTSLITGDTSYKI